MKLKSIARVDARDKLAIDQNVWTQAHGYHTEHRLLHATAVHQPGIVMGLEVVPIGGAKVYITPGVAIDALGRTIVLEKGEEAAFEEGGKIQLILHAQDVPGDSEAEAIRERKLESWQWLEYRRIIPTSEPPKGPYVELARVLRSSGSAEIREARNPDDPGKDELNLLHRVLAFPHCFASGVVAELSHRIAGGGSERPNRAGLTSFVREANGRGFHLGFRDSYPLAKFEPKQIPLFLYVAGEKGIARHESEEFEGLSQYLEHGGVVFGEMVGGSRAFQTAFEDMAERLGAPLKKVEPGSALLRTHHVFPVPPSGALEGAEVYASANGAIVLSSANYGSAWQGVLQNAHPATARERVRSAQEFGLNLVVHGARRQLAWRVANRKKAF